MATAEVGAARSESFADLMARGLAGARLETSNSHRGLREAVAANPMAVTPKLMWPPVKAMLHSVYDQPDATAMNAQFGHLIDYVAEKLPAIAERLADARDHLLVFTGFPKDEWMQIWSNNSAGHTAG